MNHISSLSLSSAGNNNQSVANHHSINLSTLASVAALAGSQQGNQQPNHHSIENSTSNTATSNHTFLLNLTSLPHSATGDHKPHLLQNHHGEQKSFILATTATPEQLSDSNNRIAVLNSANNHNLIIQFSGCRSKESTFSNIDNHYAHYHPLAVHKSATPSGTNIHGATEHQHHSNHHAKALAASSNRLAKLHAVVARSTDTPERRTTDSPEISHYDKCLSKIGLQESNLRNRRLARQQLQLQQQQQSFSRLKRARSSSVDNLSELSGDEELEIVEGMEEEMDDDRDDDDSDESMDEADGQESILKFVESVLPSVTEKDEDPEKISFLSAFALSTKKAMQENEFRHFVRSKMNHRLSHLSFKLSMIEDDDILTDDTLNRPLGSIESSDLVPTDERLNARAEEKAFFMSALDLKPASTDITHQVLQRELAWLAVLQNRQIRIKRGDLVIGRLHNNLSNDVLDKWLPPLAVKCDASKTSGPKIANLIHSFMHLSYIEAETQEVKTASPRKAKSVEPNNNNSHHNHHQSQSHATTITRTSKSHKDGHPDRHPNMCLDKHSSKHHASTHPNNKMPTLNCDNQQSTPMSLSSNHHPPQQMHHLPTSKLINSKQFAQEFHESVLQETKMKMSNKAASTDNVAVIVNHNNNGHLNHHNQIQSHQTTQQQQQNHQNAQAYHHTIIYSDSLKPNYGTATEANHLDSKPVINSAPPIPSAVAIFKCKYIDTFYPLGRILISLFAVPEKIGPLQDQIRKLQLRMSQIGQETEFLAKRKNVRHFLRACLYYHWQ